MLIQRGIMEYSLDGHDGKSASGRLVYCVEYAPAHIYCGKRCVEAEGESVGVSGLPVLNACVLICVPVEKLDLEPGGVNEKDLRCGYRKIRAEKNLPCRPVSTSEFCNQPLSFA